MEASAARFLGLLRLMVATRNFFQVSLSDSLLVLPSVDPGEGELRKLDRKGEKQYSVAG
jgi:hypothetical protein